METTLAYTFDGQGAFSGAVVTERDPLDGGWLLPPRATLTAPPEYHESNERAVMVDGSWRIMPKPQLFEVPGSMASAVVTAMSFSTFLVAAVNEGWLTESEAYEWMNGGNLPDDLVTAIEAAPEADQLKHSLDAARPYFTRLDDFYVIALHAVDPTNRLSPQEFFQLYA